MAEVTYNTWADMPQTEMGPKTRRRLISGEKVMMVQLTMAKGAAVSEHKHPHEQITHVVSGSIEFEVEGKKRTLNSGDVIYIPSNVPHGAEALVDTVTLEVFSPPREDFLSGGRADYMR